MKKIKILHFELSENPGGIESFLYNLYCNIDREKFQFDFVTRYESPAKAEAFERLGGRIIRISPYTNPFAYCRDIRRVLGNGYDVIHIHKNSAANILPFLVAQKTTDIPIIAHSHNTAPTVGGISPFLHRINQGYLWKASCAHLACSRAAGQWMYGNHGTYQVIANGVDTKRFAFDPQNRELCRKELGVADCFVIGHVGRFAEQKNHRFLIDIFRKTAERDASARLLLIGGGELEEEIRARVRQYGLEDRVLFVGMTDRVEHYLCAMDAFVLPSLHEGFPVVGIEAQASGLPCVCSDSITKETDVTGLVAFLPLTADADEWAQHILACQSGVRTQFRDRAWLKLQNAGYDMSDTARKLQKIYEDTMHKRWVAKGVEKG